MHQKDEHQLFNLLGLELCACGCTLKVVGLWGWMGGAVDRESLKVRLFLKSKAGLNTRHQWNEPSNGPRGIWTKE